MRRSSWHLHRCAPGQSALLSLAHPVLSWSAFNESHSAASPRQLDSMSLFHDSSFGANADASGRTLAMWSPKLLLEFPFCPPLCASIAHPTPGFLVVIALLAAARLLSDENNGPRVRQLPRNIMFMMFTGVSRKAASRYSSGTMSCAQHVYTFALICVSFSPCPPPLGAFRLHRLL